ncbi:hypothetical protein LWI29_004095 [Acer saccharum]|uniref:Uncharacterized protein n=1 Tax=Acer saccharum TaxID=4024 RepID=A0AA39SUA2_ACESA|nr:hypothetical protein LWI29_004095 [Acer saccharum]
MVSSRNSYYTVMATSSGAKSSKIIISSLADQRVSGDGFGHSHVPPLVAVSVIPSQGSQLPLSNSQLHAVSHFTTVPPIDLPLFLLQSRSTAFPLREQKPQSIDEDDEDPLLAPDKFYHFVFCFSLIHLFSTLASFSCYPSLRSHSISVRSIMSLLAGAAKEFAELEQMFTSPFIGAMDGHIDAVSCMAKNPNYLKGLFSGSMVGDICF